MIDKGCGKVHISLHDHPQVLFFLCAADLDVSLRDLMHPEGTRLHFDLAFQQPKHRYPQQRLAHISQFQVSLPFETSVN